MWIYTDMTHITIMIVVTVYVLLLMSLRRNPFAAAGSFVQEFFTSPKFMLHFLALIAILIFNKLEQWVERRMESTGDFTPYIHNLEGNFVATIQRMFEHPLLTAVGTYFYVVVFTAIMVASIFIYTFQKNYKLFYSVCYALMLNYMIAIPFFLFFPVNEVWYHHPGVRFLMLDVFPNFETEYRPLSGLDNCFPSLHTSISVSMALIAARSGNVFWRRFTAFSAVFIIFIIFYMGIHWLTDMMGGLVLGFIAAHVALRLAEGRSLFGGSFAWLSKERLPAKLRDR